MKSVSYLILFTKTRVNGRPKQGIKLLEENLREKLHDIGYSNDFFDTKVKKVKREKTDKLAL